MVVLGIIVLPLSTMVTCKETRVVIIALHKKGFTGKDIAASKIAPKSTIYRIIKNFKESGSIVVMTASGHPRKSSKRQDCLLKLIQLRDQGTTIQSLLRNGSRQVWVHLHVQWGKDFWRMAWCQEGHQRSHFSPGKTSGTDWYSAKGTGIGLLRTGVKSFSLMNNLSDCLGHPEKS